MFGSLSMSDRQAFNPRSWANAFRDSSGNPVNVGIQQDAEEFVNVRADHRDASQPGLHVLACAVSRLIVPLNRSTSGALR